MVECAKSSPFYWTLPFSFESQMIFHYNKDERKEDMMRLDRLLYGLNLGSKRHIRQLLRRKLIVIDGVPARELNLTVDTRLQHITVDGQHITANPHIYYMMNKPSGTVTANVDAHKKTVFDCIAPKDLHDGLYCVGRLDGDTTGLLLITNNGPLGFKMLHPSYHVTKTYAVTVNGLLTNDHVQQFAQGITFIGDITCKPAELHILHASEHESTAHVTIQEGKYHQVKKMFLCVGVKVIRLQRIQFGPLHLDPTLQEGEYRPLTTKECEHLLEYF